MADTGKKVWGCLECGAFSEEVTAKGHCSACEDGLVVELGGAPTPDKAQALIAWARKDATDQIETWGTVVGAGAGALLGIIIAMVWEGDGLLKLLILLYAGAIGAVVGRLFATAVHRVVRPHSKLQPVHNEALRRTLSWSAVAMVVVPVVCIVGLMIVGGDTDLRKAAKYVLASMVQWMDS